MSYFPTVPDTDFWGGQIARIVKDFPIDGTFAYTYATPTEHGHTHVDINLVSDGIAIYGPATFTLDLVGPKIPCVVSVTIQKYVGSTPTYTTTDYNFGNSLASQSISLPSSSHTCTRIKIIRRH